MYHEFQSPPLGGSVFQTEEDAERFLETLNQFPKTIGKRIITDYTIGAWKDHLIRLILKNKVVTKKHLSILMVDDLKKIINHE